jgi:hypothetical protein
MTKQNPLNIRIGDIVRIHLDHWPDLDPFLAKVIKVVNRAISDLIHFDPVDPCNHKYFTNPIAHHACDVGFVKEIVTRAPFSSSKKVVHNKKLWHIEFSFAQTRNYLYFSNTTISSILEDKGIHPEYGLKENLVEIWEKNGCPGLTISTSDDWFGRDRKIVRRKSFTKWVLNNVNKLSRSKSQWIKDEVEFEKKMERDYMLNLKQDVTDEFKDSQLDYENERYEVMYP